MKRLALLFIAVVITVAVSAPDPKVFAVGSGLFVPLCTSTYLDTWNWDYQFTHAINTANNAGFDRITSTYVMIKTTTTAQAVRTSSSGATAPANVYDIYWTNDSAKGGIIDINAADGAVKLNDPNAPFKHAQIISEPGAQSDVWKNYWNGFGNGTNVTDSGTFSQYTYFIGKQADINCMTNTVNFSYGPNWGYNHFSTQPMTAGTGSATSCKITDLGCLFGRLENTLSNDLSGLAVAIGKGFAAVFVPDTQMMQGDISDFTTFLNNKLGFLLFPVQFLSDLFSAFSSGSATCSDSSCTQTFGNFFGHPASINLAAAAQAMPTLWSWFRALLQGVVVVELGLMIRRKYMGLMGK